MKSPLEVTLGSDPEFMVLDTHRNRIVNAIPVIQHNKHDPFDLGDGMRLYSDNVLAEVSFPPARSPLEGVCRMKAVISKAQEKIGPRFQLLPRASHIYDEHELGPKPTIMKDKLPVEWEIGCVPNFDVYQDIQRVPIPFSDGLRTGSFHIHVGNTDYKNKSAFRLVSKHSQRLAVKIMDVVVGCASVVFDRDPTAVARRKLYGKAGEWRPTKYGIEYRCLGNYALNSPELTSLVFDLTEFAMDFIRNDTAEDVLSKISPKVVQDAINNNNIGMASAILAVVGLPGPLWKRVQFHKAPNFLKDWGLS